MATVLAMGITIGLCLGWLLMDTTRVFMSVGVSQHHGLGHSSSTTDSSKSLSAAAAANTNNNGASSTNHAVHDSTKATTAHHTHHQHKTDSSKSDHHHHHHQNQHHTNSKSSKSSSSAAELFPSSGDTIHVLMTCGGGPYQNFQSRMMYGSYKMVQKQPGGEKLVGFTRILHRVLPDALMGEMPTFHAHPLQPECDNWCEFPPASRPDAVRQFFDAAKKDPSMISAPWILMTEADYVWIKPLSAPKAEDPTASAVAFPFGYIAPNYPGVVDIMRKLYPGQPSDIPASGPAPALMRVGEWLKILPYWERLTAEIEADEDAKKQLGWVREMYAFDIACALKKVKLDLRLPPYNKIMVQPPADHTMGEGAIMHYTWGSIITDKNNDEIWRFDKREYTDQKWELAPEKLPEVPPFDAEAGWKLQDNVPVTQDLRDTLNLMMQTMNKAIEEMKPLSAVA